MGASASKDGGPLVGLHKHWVLRYADSVSPAWCAGAAVADGHCAAAWQAALACRRRRRRQRRVGGGWASDQRVLASWLAPRLQH